MADARLRCLNCFFTAVVLLGVWLHFVEASNCQNVIHGYVGGTVELPSCSTNKRITLASWKHGAEIVDMEGEVNLMFKGRMSLNRTNFSLIIRELTSQDSGEYIFLSEVDNIQMPTVTIKLEVHEPITVSILTNEITSHASNGSCTVSLKCNSTSDSKVKYKWTISNQTQSGSSTMQYSIRQQDGEVKFTCTVLDFSEASASITVKCSNDTFYDPINPVKKNIVLFLSVGGGVVLMTVIFIAVVICVCTHKKRQTGSESNDLTVYADVSDYTLEDTSSTIKLCSVYETIDNKVSAVTPGPQTVYDKIQFSHMKTPSP